MTIPMLALGAIMCPLIMTAIMWVMGRAMRPSKPPTTDRPTPNAAPEHAAAPGDTQ